MVREYKRDPQDISLALSTYTVAGSPVKVDIFGEGMIERQLAPGWEAPFRVKLESPMPFTEYAEQIGASPERVPVEEYDRQMYERWGGKYKPLELLIDPTVYEGWVESGVSRRDVEFYKMAQSGCLDIDQNVVCVHAPWPSLEITKPRRDEMVEYIETDPSRVSAMKSYVGRIIGVEGDVAYLELFEPEPFMRMPEMVVPEKIREDFYLPVSWAFGYGLHQALEERAPEMIPEGEWTEDNREYRLAPGQAVPISALKEFCDENYPDEPHCLYHALTLWVVPIELGGEGTFRPMREESAGYYQTEIEVEYEEPFE